MAEVMLDVNKTEMNRMQRLANRILEKQGIDPDVYFYKIHHEIVFENLEDVLDEHDNLQEMKELFEEEKPSKDKVQEEFMKE